MGGPGTSPGLPLLVCGPLGAWCAAPPSPSPPSLYTSLCAVVRPPSPYLQSTALPSASSLGAPGCEKSDPGAPQTPSCGRRLVTVRTSAGCVLHEHPVMAGLTSGQPLSYPPSDGMGCGDMSGSFQDHNLEDDEPLRVPLSVLDPSQLSPQCLHEASPNLPAWRVIVPRWRDHEVMPPRLPCRVIANSASEVCARVDVDPVSIDLPETEVIRGQCLPWLVPLIPFPISRFRRLAALFPSLRAAGRRSWRGGRFVYHSAESIMMILISAYLESLSTPSLGRLTMLL